MGNVDDKPKPPPSRAGVVVALMLLVPLLMLVLAVILVPAWRPWMPRVPSSAPATGHTDTASAPSGATEISGSVVDQDGEPVEGAKVSMLGPAPGFVRLGGFTTEKDGAFLFSDVRSGTIEVVAEHDSGVVISADLTIAQGTRIVDLVLALAPARAVRGTITDEEGKPIAGANLTIEEPAWATRSAKSGEDGTYRIPRVPGASRLIHVAASHYASSLSRLAAQVTGADEVIDFKLRKEADIDGIVYDDNGAPLRAMVLACDGKDADHRTVSGADGRFHFPHDLAACAMIAVHDKFAPSDPITPSADSVTLRLKAGGGISGIVVEEDGTAVATFSVGIESFTPAYGDHEFSVRSGGSTSFTDPAGAFSLEKLAPGSYVLSAGVEGRPPVRSASVDVVAGKVTRDVKIVLTRGGSVEGQVFEDEKRAAIAGAHVTFDATTSTRGGSSGATTTDANGRYRLDNAPIGLFSLRIEADGYRTRIISGLKTEPKQVLKQDIALKPGGDGGAQMEFGGVGALLGQTREGIAFTGLFDGAPATKAGAQQGDLIRRIDGQSAEGMSVSDAIQRLRGEEGSVVKVTVERSGQTVELSITRAAIVR